MQEQETIQQKDERFMRRALQEAEAARDAGEIPVGAVIVAGDRIIARAHNLTETLSDVTAHAEMQAITSAANQLGGKYLTAGALRDVCRSDRMVAAEARGVWRFGRETGLHEVRPQGAPSQVHGHYGSAGGRVPSAYD